MASTVPKEAEQVMSEMPSDIPSIWIDVGGTFADCVRPMSDGTFRTHKLLSNGVYRMGVDGAHGGRITLDASRDDPPGFFVGWRAQLLAQDAGHRPGASGIEPLGTVVRHEGRELEIDGLLPSRILRGSVIELDSGLPAPVVGVRWLLGRTLKEKVGPLELKLGTTRGTNALLERQGARVALVTTKGFGDVLRIGYQNRPKLFSLNIQKPSALYEAVVEIDERLDSAGVPLKALDPGRVREALTSLVDRGITSLAVCLLHSYRNGAHEEAVGEIARELGFAHVSLSSRLSSHPRMVPRGETTVVDAYLTPVIRSYVDEIQSALPQARFRLMTSAGSLVDARRCQGKDSVLSGPAGGVIGVARAMTRAGIEKAIGLDMGGTSTDVCRCDGELERRIVMELADQEGSAGIRIVAPMLAIETVAAGGGSLCWFDGQKVAVGPRSAGSDPGPACYGRGGPLTLTDVNVFLGRMIPKRFAFPLDRAAAESRLRELRDSIVQAADRRYELTELALGLIQIANANMAAAIRKVSLAKGKDVRDHALVSFGGAGAQHACALARELGMRTILQHPLAGVLSAVGIGLAEIVRFAHHHVGKPCDQTTLDQLESIVDASWATLQRELIEEGVAPNDIQSPRITLDLRYRGQESTIATPWLRRDARGAIARGGEAETALDAELGAVLSAFETLHRDSYGFVLTNRPIELVSLRMELAGGRASPPRANSDVISRPASSTWFEPVVFERGAQPTPIFERSALAPGDFLDGPAVVVEATSTILVEEGWRARMTAEGDLVLTDQSPVSAPLVVSGTNDNRADPIALELFNNQMASIAERMGVTLERTALSTNVKERLDFSCAVFTASGDLVVNAPHVPVHLGAMGQTVKQLLLEETSIAPGDVFITNDPFAGGSHLPDVTVLTPVFDRREERLLFFTGSRAHHAEIGGIAPGSMPPFARSLAEEGVLLRRFRLVAEGRSREEELRRRLSAGPYPSRSVDENVADAWAQVAANRVGASLLSELVDRWGLERTLASMGHLQQASDRATTSALLRFAAGVHEFRDRLDNDAEIRARISIDPASSVENARRGFDSEAPNHQGREQGEGVLNQSSGTRPGRVVTIDFAGTSPVLRDSHNANPAIVRAAVLYVLRSLIDEPIPLNDGVLASVRIDVPAGSFLHPIAASDPTQCPAVGAGNVETSQRVVDVLLGALGIAAASQGTMNNLSFGRDANEEKPGFGYYETIAGGVGATSAGPGASGVHSHMTNTRITDPEVLETRYPVRLLQFALRRGSGGRGRHAGGDGVIREFEFLEPLVVSVLTNRRKYRPYGAAGGEPGSAGINTLLRAGSTEMIDLGPSRRIEVAMGDRLRIETPGGGGWGVAVVD